jgi:hypothetical protein
MAYGLDLDMVSADTWTLILGLVVFAVVRYFVRRHLKSKLDGLADATPPAQVPLGSGDKKVTIDAAKAEVDATCCGKDACCRTSGSRNEQCGDRPLVILYGTTTGTSRQLADQLAVRLRTSGLKGTTVRDCADFGKNIDDEFAAYAKNHARLVSGRSGVGQRMF